MIDAATTAAIFAGLIGLGQVWANYQLRSIHRLTNQNFSEQKLKIAEQTKEIEALKEVVKCLSQPSPPAASPSPAGPSS